jgi:hypothetical protein
MLKTLTSILTIFFCSLCYGQSDSTNRLCESPYNIKLTYISTIIYPGASAGIEIPLKMKNMHILRNERKSKTISRSRFISGNLNWYHHPYFHNNLYITAEWVMRRTRNSGTFWEFSCGPGFSRTFLGGTTYRVSDNGGISTVGLAGYNYALITIGEGFGIDFSVKKQKPFSAVLKMNLISMFPYNSTIYIRPVLELGVRYCLHRSKIKLINI